MQRKIPSCGSSQKRVVKMMTAKTHTPTRPCYLACQHVVCIVLLGLDSLGLRALQSAHLSFPGTDLTKSCSMRSLRACCLLLTVAAILFRKVSGKGAGKEFVSLNDERVYASMCGERIQ
jgi:hypothetical protein